MTIKSTISDNSKVSFCNKNTQRYACYKINKNQWSSFVFAQMNATNCIGGQNKIRYLYSVFVILYAVRGVKGLIKTFELIVWRVQVQLWLKVRDWARVWRMMSHASSGRKSWGSRGMTLTVRVVPSAENSGLRVSKWKRTASLAWSISSALWQGMEMRTKCFGFILILFFTG